ncbi:MAG: polysaccharide deacetylase family protein [Alphaproteobacteria bacterium]|nr:polysaccharide deacetylase family protein [Alphaproteobacteria bacterium]
MQIGSVLMRFGLDRWLRAVAGGSGVILGLHRLRPPAVDRWSYLDGLTITPSALSATLAMLRAEGYHPCRLRDSMNWSRRQGRFFCLTFDDGYRDNLTHLVPVLEQWQVPATVFIATGFIDRTARLWWDDIETILSAETCLILTTPMGEERLDIATPAAKTAVAWQLVRRLLAAPAEAATALLEGLEARYRIDPVATVDSAMLTATELAELARHPLIEIGAHTVDHHPLTALNEADAMAAITHGRARLETLIDQPVSSFAYPFGSAVTFSDRDVRLVEAAGFERAVTSLPGPVRHPIATHRLRLPRIPVSGHNAGARVRLALTGVRRPGR